MPITPANRKLEAYHLHAHIGPEALGSYSDLFSKLSRLPDKSRVYSKKSHMIALSTIEEIQDGVFLIVAHEGEPGLKPLILNLGNFSERSSELDKGEIVSTRTHALIHPKSRKAVIEYNQRGVKAEDIGTAISRISRQFYGDSFTFDFTPVIRESFVKDLQELDRVRLASVTMTKPNLNWSSEASALVMGADESNAGRIAIEISAMKGESLSKRHGFIHGLISLIRGGTTSIKQAKIEGRISGRADKVTVKLHNHVESRTIETRRDEAGHPESKEVISRLHDFLDEMTSRG